VTISPSKIVCVGRNYLEHARELGNEVPERPLLFFKPPSSIIRDGDAIVLPAPRAGGARGGDRGGDRGAGAQRAGHRALDHIVGYAPLNDVTARDLQKTDGQWARAKGFDTFCPVGVMVPATGIDPGHWRSSAG
jgi:2-keto-4-pentenoate hydratase/2-oxohepta-3-ene-1,7-dioic acid hydratase in catechol pathway